jgi:hypothetical protein
MRTAYIPENNAAVCVHCMSNVNNTKRKERSKLSSPENVAKRTDSGENLTSGQSIEETVQSEHVKSLRTLPFFL